MTFSTQLQRKLVCNDVRGVILTLLNLLQHQVHIPGGGALAYFQGNVFGEKVSGGKLLYLSPYTPTRATVPAFRTHWEAVPMADLDGVVALAVFSAAAELAMSAGHGKWDHDPAAFLQVFHALSGFFHNSHGLMA